MKSRVSPIYEGPKEIDYCEEIYSYSDPVTITGKATYQARQILDDQINGGGLGEPGLPKPIRYAEVQVTNKSGELIQCTETTSEGSFSFTLPRGDEVFIISVNSRSNNSHLKASVLNAPEQNIVYGIKKNIFARTDQDLGTLNAAADGDILGGAFNILDQLLKTNEFLRRQVGRCSSSYKGCPNFTVAPKVSVYWEKGFNPNSYSATDSPGSFYYPGYYRMFILGGANGDTDSSDTDHFDNSVIIHEFGHFLEDTIFKSDSPGGIHYGDSVIDPRLAWSEGWGNFLQGAVLGNKYYIDTIGNSSGSTNYRFKIDIENKSRDIPQHEGEGIFREFSVTRLLYDVHDGPSSGDSDNDVINDGFSQIWTTLTSPDGFKNKKYAFRSIDLLHQLVTHKVKSSVQNWNTLRTDEKHLNGPNFRKEFAFYVTTTSSSNCGLTEEPYTITPYRFNRDKGNFETSHLLKNNDFYHFKHSGGSIDLTLKYKTPNGTEADLDLFLYGSDAIYGYNWIKSSFKTPSDSTSSEIETENIQIPHLPAGDYLINVMVYTGLYEGYGLRQNIGDNTEYELTLGGKTLCPDAL